MGADPKIHIEDKFQLERWEAMDHFLSETYSPENVWRYRPLFDWMFADRENNSQANIICAWNGDNLVGTFGYIPCDLFWGNCLHSIKGAWGSNWMTLKEYRKGCGWVLMRRWGRLFPVVLGQAATSDNLRLAPSLGFVIYDRIPRYVGIFDIDAVYAFMCHGDIKPDPKRIAACLITEDVCQNYDEVIFVEKKIDPKIFSPNWLKYPALKYGTVRHADYLQWRYLDHPFFVYQVLVAGDASTPAVCVYRVEKTSGAVSTNVGRILELFHSSDEIGREMGCKVLATALHAMKQAGCIFCDFYCSSLEYGNTVKGFGFVEEINRILPHRLSPIDFALQGQIHQNVEFRISAKNLEAPEGIGAMYITKSDGDQDRPSRGSIRLLL